MLEFRGNPTPHLSNLQVVDWVLDAGQSEADQSFFAAGLLRLLAIAPELVHNAPPETRLGVLKLAGRLPKVAKALEVDKGAQGFERLKTLEAAAPEATRYLREALQPPRELHSFEQARQRLLRVYANPLVRAIAIPFFPSSLAKAEVEEVLASVGRYTGADSRERLRTYRQARDELEKIVSACQGGVSLSFPGLFLTFFRSVLQQLEAEFLASPMNRPAAVTVRLTGRKYPFGVIGAGVRIACAVENMGTGVAFDVAVAVDADSSLELAAPSHFLDEIAPSAVFEPVEFPAHVRQPVSHSVAIVCRVTWTNGDGTTGEWEDMFDLEPQRGDIPWDELALEEPYSLEPVRRASELVGRSEQTSQLIAKLRAPSVGSFWIYGQRRVGKTSVVESLADRKETAGLTFLSLETGMFIDPDPRITVNNLGEKICNRVIASSHKFRGLARPAFDGALAPLDDFLSEALARDPDLRLVIVLDEFDELPPELYQRGGAASHALFMTFRSLSARPQIGFIFVGGERMPEILGAQGEVLNKFRPLRIDYLDRESQWADFVELVTRPVETWATIAPDAVSRVYDATAGNPFFTKFVCSNLLSDMLSRRDAFAAGPEVKRAVDTTVRQAGVNQFQHFWDDGVVAATEERSAQEQAIRRRILMALGEVLREGGSATATRIAERAERYGVSEGETLRILSEFEKRRVLVVHGSGYRCKVGLFERWLVDEGVNELALSLVEQDRLRADIETEERRRVKGHEITALAESWGSYRGMPVTDIQIRTWLEQFDGMEEQRLMFELLEGVRFYSGSLLREKLRGGHGFVTRELAARGVARVEQVRARRRTDNVLVSYFGGEGKRGPLYAKLYADENSLYHERIVAPEKLPKKLEELRDVEGVVFVDDFLGTGRTANAALMPILERLGTAVNARGIDVFLVTVSGFTTASDSVVRKMSSIVPRSHVSIADPLDESDRCFSDTSTVFSDEAKRSRARGLAEAYGKRLVSTHPLGHGGSEALVVFEMTCPNNSLPILWAEGSRGDWRPLFSRP
jgi:hypothetical protein